LAKQGKFPMESLKRRQLIMYNLSAAGYTLLITLLLFYSNQFFLPAGENMQEGMVPLLPDFIFGIIPVLGLLMIGSIIVHTVADPLIASWSDNCRSKLGKRRFFLIMSGFPLAISTELLFFPPFNFPTILNTFYVAILFGLFFLFYSVYVVPYLSLIPELGQSEKKRLKITTAQGFSVLIGAALVITGGPLLYQLLAKNHNPSAGYQFTTLLLSAMGAVLLYSAVMAIKEKKYSAVQPITLPFWASFKKTLKNRPFIIFLVGSISCWFMFNIICFSLKYIGETLMVVDESYNWLITAIIFTGAAMFFPLVYILSCKIGKKQVFMVGLACFSLLFLLISLTGLGSNPNGLTCNYVTAITTCTCGTTWFGTARGISALKETKWEYYSRESGLSDSSITSVLSMPDGLWVGTKNGISIHRLDSWKILSSKDGLADNRVTALATDKNGVVWCGTINGLSRFDGTSWRTFSTENGLIANEVTALAVDEDGIVWCGSKQGLSSYNGNQWRSFTVENGLTSNLVTALVADPDGTLWCGTANGLCHYDGSAWTSYKEEDGLINNRVNCLNLSPGGLLWVGTNNGLCTFSGTKWSSFTQEQVLSNNRISAIYIKDSRNIWIGTRVGLSHLYNDRWEKYVNTTPIIWALGLFALLGFSVAVLLVLPNVFIADLCDYDFKQTGEHREAMYFGVHGFFLKLNLGVAAAVLAFFYLVLGKDIANPLGVRLVCIAASAVGITGIIILLKYPDKSVKGSDAEKPR
jgi:GPH family glycoside/pentoside/hexuronide:cation symporter